MEIRINSAAQISHDDCVALWEDHAQKGITAEYLCWRYRKCFGDGTRQIALYKDDQLIGQAIVFAQQMASNGNLLRVAQLGDLVVKKEHRSLAAVRAIYKGLRDVLHGGDYDFAFTLPNERSIVLNRRFLGMQDASPLRSNFGFHAPGKTAALSVCEKLSPDQLAAGLDGLPDALSCTANQIHWERSRLLCRMADCVHPFGVTATREGMIVVSRRKLMNLPVLLIMAAFRFGEGRPAARDWKAMVSGAVSLFKTPLTLYTGHGNGEFFSGLDMTKWHRHALKPVQILNLASCAATTYFARLELIDTDVA